MPKFDFRPDVLAGLVARIRASERAPTVDIAAVWAKYGASVRWFFSLLWVIAILFYASSRGSRRASPTPTRPTTWSAVAIYDLCAIGVVMVYVAFVGAWHTWERLTGRMELERHHDPGAPDRRV